MSKNLEKDEFEQMEDLLNKNLENFRIDPNVAEELDKLQKVLEAGKYNHTPVYQSALQVEDLSELANKYLSASAKLDVSRKSKLLELKNEDGLEYKTIYFSAVVKTGNEELAVQEIAKIVNDLSQQGLIHSTLAPISSLQLAINTRVLKVVFCFPLVPVSSIEACKTKYGKFFTLEGDVGIELEDLSVPLQEGEFLVDIRIAHQLAMLTTKEVKPLKDLVQDEIDRYLKFLPEGTEVVQVTPLVISDLSAPYEVKFKHPQMYDVSKVELSYTRCVRPLENGLEQYNRYLGLRYFDKSGKEMYQY